MLASQDTETVAQLMVRFRDGDSSAAGQLVELLYPELRRLASGHMKRERAGHTLSPTALVNELYLSLVRIKGLGGSVTGEERTAFLSLAARMMRRRLISHARPLSFRAATEALPELADPHQQGAEGLLAIDGALDRLGAIDPRLRTVVELRVFEGLNREEIAERMGCGPATVSRQWNFARLWLEREFAEPAKP